MHIELWKLVEHAGPSWRRLGKLFSALIQTNKVPFCHFKSTSPYIPKNSTRQLSEMYPAVKKTDYQMHNTVFLPGFNVSTRCINIVPNILKCEHLNTHPF